MGGCPRRGRWTSCKTVFNVDQALYNEQVSTRGIIGYFNHSAVVKIPSIEHPLNFEDAESGFDFAPPLLGEDTESVLRETGYMNAEIEALWNANAIAGRRDNAS